MRIPDLLPGGGDCAVAVAAVSLADLHAAERATVARIGDGAPHGNTITISYSGAARDQKAVSNHRRLVSDSDMIRVGR